MIRSAATWYGCSPGQVLPFAGTARAALAGLASPGRVVLPASASEAQIAAFSAQGWSVAIGSDPDQISAADLVLIENPCPLTGCHHQPDRLILLARRVKVMVVDEGLLDPRPDLSLASDLPANAVILRSMAPLWGLADTGFALAHPDLLARLARALPPLGEPARNMTAAALADLDFADQTVLYLSEAGLWLDRHALAAGWGQAGGTHLFRLYHTPDAAGAEQRLARAQISVFRPHDNTLRLAIPVLREERDRLTDALRG